MSTSEESEASVFPVEQQAQNEPEAKPESGATGGRGQSQGHDQSGLPITVLPELENLLPPLTSEEKAELRRSIESEGIRDCLLVWRTTRDNQECRILIDGHNRYRIAESLGRPLSSLPVASIDFTDMEEAKAWIIANQLMRRNLTDEQRAYFRGAAYDAAKKAGFKGNQHTESGRGKSCPKQNTAEKLGEQFGVSARTVKNNAAYAKRVDALPSEEKAEVLAGKKKLPKVVKPKANKSEEPDEGPAVEPEPVNPAASPAFDLCEVVESSKAEDIWDAVDLIDSSIDRAVVFFTDLERLDQKKGSILESRCRKLKARIDELWETAYAKADYLSAADF